MLCQHPEQSRILIFVATDKQKHMKIPNIIIFTLLIFSMVSCNYSNENKRIRKGLIEVQASAQTAAVPDNEDAADDPAVWVNVQDPSKSFIIGTNKQRGLVVYNLEGKQVFSYDCGRVNNVDVRQGFPLAGEMVGLVAASNRSGNVITLTRIMPDGTLADVSARPIQSDLSEVYGFCLYHELKANTFYAFINGKEGGVEQWLLFDDGQGKVDAQRVRTFEVGSQTEGCVADDELGHFYIGEENKGIWKYSASPTAGDERVMVDSVSGNNLVADVEGLAIFYAHDGKGYFIASSQGNNTFAVYERQGKNKYLGSFAIVDGEIDGVEETDGIDVCSTPLGASFPHGVFIAQDGFNKEGGQAVNQNFKMVPWEVIAKAF
jgi:3-phytase